MKAPHFPEGKGMRCRTPRCAIGIGAALVVCTVLTSPVRAATRRVAVISSNTNLCALLQNNGFACDILPSSGPTGPLDAYDVVIHAGTWTDPDGALADFMRAGKGVLTLAHIPQILGIDTNPTVQAWIGANRFLAGDRNAVTVTTDIILGSLPAGTILAHNGFALAPGLSDTTGHPNARVLARWGNGTTQIALMRNHWEGGRSVYGLLGGLGTEQTTTAGMVTLNAVRFAAGELDIPATSTWGVIALTLLLASAGTVLVRRRARAWVP